MRRRFFFVFPCGKRMGPKHFCPRQLTILNDSLALIRVASPDLPAGIRSVTDEAVSASEPMAQFRLTEVAADAGHRKLKEIAQKLRMSKPVVRTLGNTALAPAMEVWTRF
jgi:hypothetical protein